MSTNDTISWDARGGKSSTPGISSRNSLSIDSIYMFLLIFTHFQVPSKSQHTVLLWGLLGALVMRAALILADSAILIAFHWVFHVFGTFLIATGVKMLKTINDDPDLSGNRVT